MFMVEVGEHEQQTLGNQFTQKVMTFKETLSQSIGLK